MKHDTVVCIWAIVGAAIGFAAGVGAVFLLMLVCQIVFNEECSFFDIVSDSYSTGCLIIMLSTGAVAALSGMLAHRWAQT